MKIRYYIDVMPGTDFRQYIPFANPNPGAKILGYKRFAFDVTLPDQLLFDIDSHAPEVSRPELVADVEDEA